MQSARSMSDQRSSRPTAADPVCAAARMRSSRSAWETSSLRHRSRSSGGNTDMAVRRPDLLESQRLDDPRECRLQLNAARALGSSRSMREQYSQTHADLPGYSGGRASSTFGFDEKTTFDRSDFRNIVPRFTPEARKANQALVDLLGRLAGRKHATPAQLALAWLLARKPWIGPIPGPPELPRLEENLGAVDLALTAGDLGEIEGAAAEITVQGARYPEELERRTGL